MPDYGSLGLYPDGYPLPSEEKAPLSIQDMLESLQTRTWPPQPSGEEEVALAANIAEGIRTLQDSLSGEQIAELNSATPTPSAFRGWAHVELRGYKAVSGYVEETSLFGKPFLRIDVPHATKPFQFFITADAVWSLGPATEEAARRRGRRGVIDVSHYSGSVWQDEYPESYDDPDPDLVDPDDLPFS